LCILAYCFSFLNFLSGVPFLKYSSISSIAKAILPGLQ
jgi:hypothetical protein